MMNIKKTIALCAMALVLTAASSNTGSQLTSWTVSNEMVAMGPNPATR